MPFRSAAAARELEKHWWISDNERGGHGPAGIVSRFDPAAVKSTAVFSVEAEPDRLLRL